MLWEAYFFSWQTELYELGKETECKEYSYRNDL